MADGEAAKLICEAGCLRIRNFTCATSDAMSGCSCILCGFFGLSASTERNSIEQIVTVTTSG